MKYLFPLFLIFSLGCDDKITESKTEVVDRPNACPAPNPELEASEFSFSGITSITEINRTSAVVNWEDNENFSSFLVVAVGSIERSILGSAVQGASQVTIKGLTPNTTYRVLVRAIDKRGFMEPNDKTLSFTTLPWPNFSNFKSLKFGGTQAVQLGESSNFDLSKSFTISAWVKKQELAEADQRIFSFHRNRKSAPAVSLGVHKNKVKLVYRNVEGKKMTFKLENNYADSSWHQWALVYDQEFIQLYIDGTEFFKIKDQLEGVTGSHQAHIASTSGTQRAFIGLIDEFAFFQESFSDPEITELFGSGKAYDLRDHSKSQSLKNWYRFGDENADGPSSIQDVVGNLNAVPLNVVEADFSNDSP